MIGSTRLRVRKKASSGAVSSAGIKAIVASLMMSKRVAMGWFDSAEFDVHRAPAPHPERPERLEAIRERLHSSGLAELLVRVEPQPIEAKWVLRVHSSGYVDRLSSMVSSGGGFLDADTYVTPGSEKAAQIAAGAVSEAVVAVLRGDLQRALCTVRPPGHHARAVGGMGFCLFNNVAIGAEVALGEPGVERVAILDFDVHHGNGTEEIFYERSDVFYASVHQRPAYPGSGGPGDKGHGKGWGLNLNVPLPPGAGDQQLLAAWHERIAPALETFAPQILLISAGFDADRRDPLAQLEVTTEGFRSLSFAVVEFADRICGGRIVSVLEGGYDVTALADDVQAHLEALLHRGPLST